jgi:hypothetical protein
MWMNGAEVEQMAERFDAGECPNLFKASRILERLMDWTDSNSDGWPYWQKPSNAANKLMDLLQAANRWDPVDVTEADLKRALSPIKSFLTKQGVEHAKILEDPPAPTYRPGVIISRDQLEAWAGRPLTNEQVERLDRAIPHSSIPEAVATIVESMP